MTKEKVIQTIKELLQNPDGSFISLDEYSVDVLAEVLVGNSNYEYDEEFDKSLIEDIVDDAITSDIEENETPFYAVEDGAMETITFEIGEYFDRQITKALNKNNPFNRIKEFLVMHTPSDNPTSAKLILGAKLIFEELLEYAEACDVETQGFILSSFQDMLDHEDDKFDTYYGTERKYNRVAMFDAQVDILYVLANAAFHCNLHHKMIEGFLEVHENNASKVTLSKEDVMKIYEAYPGDPDDLTTHNILGSTACWVTNSDGKILKTSDHPKPNLKKILGIDDKAIQFGNRYNTLD